MTWRPSIGGWKKAAEKLGTNAASEMAQYIADSKSGKIRTLPMPWPNLSTMSRALVPGGLTTVCAAPGVGKSILTLQLSYSLHHAGIPCRVMMLEHPPIWHTRRLYAMLAGEPGLADDNWIAERNGEVQALCEPHDSAVTDFFYHVETFNNGQATYRDLIRWLGEHAARGTRYFLIDPITGIKTPEKPWSADQEFLSEARKIMEQHNASLVMITHPRKGHGRMTGMDDMANGAAFARFTDCVLWLEKPEKEVPIKVDTPAGSYTAFANRVIKINKASNSIGGGMKVGFKFDKMHYRELGLAAKDVDKAKAEGYEAQTQSYTPDEDISNLFDSTPKPPTKPWHT